MPSTLRLVFAGTPEFAVPALEATLASGHVVSAIYTQPDRPAGRGRQLQASPVKRRALAAGVEVRQPQSLRDPETREALAALAPDLMVVVAYGLILPRAVLAIPRHGCWNIHASLLPRWRGAAPIQRALEAGDARTGVCLMQMAAGLDTGPVLLTRQTAIGEEDTGQSLHDRLARLGAEVLAEGLAALAAGTLPAAVPQDDGAATHAAKLDKAESVLDWAQPAAVLARKVRAFEPWPGTEAEVGGERVRVWRAQALSQAHRASPGTVLGASREGIDIACGEDVLRLTGLQRPGGRRVDAGSWLNGRPALRVGG